jgi:hypothetical protein
LITRCRLFDASDKTAGQELHQKTIGHLQLPEWCSSNADSILNELLGWMHTTSLARWQQKQPAWIKRDHFVNQLHAILDGRKRRISRERAVHLIPVGEEKIGEEKGSIFVKQLHLITDDESIVDTSIREFIQCNIEKARLSAEGNITDEDWLAFESALLTRWDKIRVRNIRIGKGSPEEEVGCTILSETTEAHCEKLAGSETEQVYLTSGTYHRLAELIRVGWHPRFKELLEELTKQ